MRPGSMSCWMRVSRRLTIANSAATKNALAATKRTTTMIQSSTRVTMAFNYYISGGGRVAGKGHGPLLSFRPGPGLKETGQIKFFGTFRLRRAYLPVNRQKGEAFHG